MRNKTDPQQEAILWQPGSQAVLASLPNLEDLSERSREELILALASLMIHDPALGPWLEVRYEPE
jgi:hypothetical protein